MNFYMKCQANENIFLNNTEFAAPHVTGNIFVRSTPQIHPVSATITGGIFVRFCSFSRQLRKPLFVYDHYSQLSGLFQL